MVENFLAKTKNGISVFLDENSEHAKTHISKFPLLLGATVDLLPTIEVLGDTFRKDFDVGHTVGTSDLVETDMTDDIVYALRTHRDRYSRFVKNRQATNSSWIVIDIRRRSAGSFYLYTCYVGQLTPSFPGGDFLPEKSHGFWSKHALVWGNQEVVSGSETATCPW